MKRKAVGGLVALTAITAACSGEEAAPQPAPVTVAAASPVTTTVPPPPPTTVAPTTVPPTTAAPEKPTVTAVPVIVPIAKREEPTTPVVATLPQVPVESGDPWTGSFVNENTGDTTPIQVGWIAIPKIGVDHATFAPRYQSSQAALDRSVNYGPTYWANRVLPGQEGNAIITGHRTSHGGPFRNIDQLVPGDEILVTGFDGVPYTYLVESSTVVYPDNTSWVPGTGGSMLTLYSCHPPTSTRQRILVFARLKA